MHPLVHGAFTMVSSGIPDRILGWISVCLPRVDIELRAAGREWEREAAEFRSIGSTDRPDESLSIFDPGYLGLLAPHSPPSPLRFPSQLVGMHATVSWVSVANQSRLLSYAEVYLRSDRKSVV